MVAFAFRILIGFDSTPTLCTTVSVFTWGCQSLTPIDNAFVSLPQSAVATLTDQIICNNVVDRLRAERPEAPSSITTEVIRYLWWGSRRFICYLCNTHVFRVPRWVVSKLDDLAVPTWRKLLYPSFRMVSQKHHQRYQSHECYQSGHGATKSCSFY